MVVFSILLGVSLFVLFVSLGVIIFSVVSAVSSGGILTGAVIGTSGVVSYAFIVFILSLVAVFFLVLVLKKPEKELREYYSASLKK